MEVIYKKKNKQPKPDSHYQKLVCGELKRLDVFGCWENRTEHAIFLPGSQGTDFMVIKMGLLQKELMDIAHFGVNTRQTLTICEDITWKQLYRKLFSIERIDHK